MYDVIIIGAGPAGITASLYAKRRNLKTLVIYKKKSALEKTKKIENYYGFVNGISGEELYKNGIKQAKNLGVEVIEEEVTGIQIDIAKIEEQKSERIFKIETLNNEYKSKSVILATGNNKNKPNIENIDKFEGKGISYCAICDGFFYKNKSVAVIGSGNYALAEVNHLKDVVGKIKILTNGQEVPKYKQENIEIIDKKIKSINGNDKVEEIEFKDNTKLSVDGIFIAQGVAGSIDFAKKLGAKIEDEKIVVDENMKTTVKGLFACGDCTGGLYQISKAIYEGTIAGLKCLFGDVPSRRHFLKGQRKGEIYMEFSFNLENFEREVINSTQPVLVDFYADWCGPCKMMGPVIEELAGELQGKAKVGKINVDDNQDLAIKYNVMSIPTLIIFKNGKEVKRFIGVTDKNELLNEF